MTQSKQSSSIGRRYIVNVMLRRSALLLMLGSLAGCAGGLGQTFMVQFMPFSATPDAHGQATVQAAIAFAKANPLDPITIDGFHYGQYANQFDTMGEERVRAVVSILVDGGISGARISILGEGMAYAQGSPMPSLPRGTVKIAIGL
jgi:ABC-type glycerol-3-phosphate transport system substrate-binding protein